MILRNPPADGTGHNIEPVSPAPVTPVGIWLAAHRRYHEASDAYNTRLSLVRAERERGNWSMTADPEYKALNDAQWAALAADEDLYATLTAGQ